MSILQAYACNSRRACGRKCPLSLSSSLRHNVPSSCGIYAHVWLYVYEVALYAGNNSLARSRMRSHRAAELYTDSVVSRRPRRTVEGSKVLLFATIPRCLVRYTAATVVKMQLSLKGPCVSCRHAKDGMPRRAPMTRLIRPRLPHEMGLW